MNLKQYVSFSKLLLLCAVLLLHPVHSLGAPRNPSQSSPSSGLVYVLLIIQILWILLSIFVYLKKIRPLGTEETSGSDSVKKSQGFATKTQETQKNSQVEKSAKKITAPTNEINSLENTIKTLKAKVLELEQRLDTKQDRNTDDPEPTPQTSSAQVAPTSTGETTPAVISMQAPQTLEPTYHYIEGIPASKSGIDLEVSKPSPCYFQVKVTGNGETAELSLCDDYRSEGEKGGIENNLRECELIEIEGGGNGTSFELVNWGTGTIQNNRFKMCTPIKYKRKG